mmetsp:Transcript_32319/g.103057  ORF Transcript_32319/g.103057 Transcript_32319/m.103057 type:complete len:364 (+) Transcript_32319:164-1255(+)
MLDAEPVELESKMNPEAKLFQKVSLKSLEKGEDSGCVDERTARNIIAALRAEMAEDIEDIRRDMISSLSAEREARAALSRRVYDLAHELSEEKCLRESDARRIGNLESKLARYEALYKRPGQPWPSSPPSSPSDGGGIGGGGSGLLQGTSSADQSASSSYHRLVAEARPLLPLAETHVEVGGVVQSLPPPPPLTAEALRHLEDEILALCDAAPLGAVLCANLPRQYYYRYRKQLDFRALGFMKMSQLLAKMDRLQVSGSHRAQVARNTAGTTTDLNPPLVTDSSDDNASDVANGTSDATLPPSTDDASSARGSLNSEKEAAYQQFLVHRVKKLETTCKSLEFQLQLAVNKQTTWRSMMHTNPY